MRPRLRLILAAIAALGSMVLANYALWAWYGGEPFGFLGPFLMFPGIAAGLWLSALFAGLPLPLATPVMRLELSILAFAIARFGESGALAVFGRFLDPGVPRGLSAFAFISSIATAGLVCAGYGYWAQRRFGASTSRRLWAAWLPSGLWAAFLCLVAPGVGAPDIPGQVATVLLLGTLLLAFLPSLFAQLLLMRGGRRTMPSTG